MEYLIESSYSPDKTINCSPQNCAPQICSPQCIPHIDNPCSTKCTGKARPCPPQAIPAVVPIG